jgi:3-hydroxyisobutyrate dehydrogenase-like beta-hydroxyacid dehydrogenase
VRLVEVGADVGRASAVKMCTASVYKGTKAVLAHALLTAERHGALDVVLADLARDGYDAETVQALAVAATKAHRHVGEMREIAATQAGAGLTPALFEGMAAAYAGLATAPLAAGDPESVDASLPAPADAEDGIAALVRGLRPAATPGPA